MKIELIRDGSNVRIKLSMEGGWHPFGGSMDVEEVLLVPEARRLKDALDKAIKEAEIAQRPGSKSLGSY